MSTVYFKVLDVHEYGWYAYAEDDIFILGDDYPQILKYMCKSLCPA